MLTVQSVSLGGNRQPAFKCHLPGKFSAMMNYIYKKTPMEMFETPNIMRVETKLDDGREISGLVTFANGHYNGLIMDDGFENLRQEFMRTALKRYNTKLANPKLQRKLGYIA